MTVQTQRLDQEMNALLRTLRQHSQDIAPTLTELAQGIVRLLPPVMHAGITTTVHGEITTQASTGPFPTQLDDIQRRSGAGPCLWAACNEDMLRVDDIEHDPRWPDYRREAIERTPIRSVLSLALITETKGRSALNVYAEKPHAFDVYTTETAVTYAAYTATAWMLVRHEAQFQQALASRDVIGQAKGMIMERFSIGADQAFELLKRLSQSSNTQLAQVASQLVRAQKPKPNPARRTT